MKVSQDGPVLPEPPRPVVTGEHAPNDVLVDLDAEGPSDLLGDAHAAEARVAPLHLDDGRDEFRRRAFGTGSAATRRGREEQYLRSTNALWNLSSVAGLTSAPSFGSRPGRINRVASPSTTRSTEVRFGARCRERLLMSS